MPSSSFSFLASSGRWVAAVVLGASCALAVAASGSAILSNEGSGRATAYTEQNKIIALHGKTHVVWLDAVDAGFRVRGRTLDQAAGTWSEVVTIGEAQDNHGGPALTVDSQGFLHIAYYPHHQAIRYRRSVRPNDLSAWEPEIQFGEGLSYPALLCAPDDTLLLTARRGFFDAQGKYLDQHYLEQEFWVKPPGQAWARKTTLLRGRFDRYAQFATGLAWSPDRQTIHLAGRIYEMSADPQGKPSYTVVYMKSGDRGDTWTTSRGDKIQLPATADTVDVLARDDDTKTLQLASASLAVSPQGLPHVIYTAEKAGRTQLIVATPDPSSGWTQRDVTESMPEAVKGWKVNLAMGGGITISDSGRITLVAVVVNPSPEEAGTLKEWGHPTTEVVRMWSDDGLKTIHSEVFEPMDAHVPHWLVNIERATGHNAVSDEPGIIFTAGIAGGGLKDLSLANRVMWHPRN
ncbi:MAG: BNR-4 repeat-containing protein [Opitutus sp.]